MRVYITHIATFFLLLLNLSLYGQVGINNPNPHSSAILDLTSNTKGLLIPRMTFGQRLGIASPALGLTVYQTNLITGFYYYNGSSWKKIDASASSIADNDEDTKIEVEKNANENKIRFTIGSKEVITMQKNINSNFSLLMPSVLNNTYMGVASGSNNLTGVNNTAIGDSTLRLATSSYNTALGQRCLSALTSGSENTAIGFRTMQNTSFGSRNVAVGNEALYGNLGSDNVGIGLASLRNNIAGSHNVGIGIHSLFNNNIGTRNVGIGAYALSQNTGNDNTAIGYHALKNGSGSRNTAVGNYSMEAFISGNDNTGLGFKTLKNFNSGSFNTALGTYTLQEFNAGSHNTAVGVFALKNLQTGSHNTALGNGALSQGTSSDYNTALGKDALLITNNSQYNTALGYQALRNNTTGSYNTAAGYQSLFTNTVGNYNTGIGYLANVGANNLINATAIGSRSYVNKSNALILGSIAGENGATENSRVILNYNTIRSEVLLDLFGYFKGFLPPRMTTAQMNAINNPASGLFIYNNTTHSPWIFNGDLWEDFNLPLGHYGAQEGEGITYNSTETTFFPGFAPAISDSDENSRVEVNITAPFDNGGSTRVVLQGQEVFKLETYLPDYYSNLRLDNENLTLFLGENAGLEYVSSGNHNVGIGSSALQNLFQATKLIGIGANTIKNGWVLQNEIAIGTNAMFNQYNSIGNNIAIGKNALYSETSGDSCIAIGYHAINDYTENSNNIAVGALTEVEGVNSVAIGARAKVVGDNRIVLGSIDGVNGATASAKVAIGVTSPEAMLHVKASVGAVKLEDLSAGTIRIRHQVTGGENWDVEAFHNSTEANAHIDFQYASTPATMKIFGNGDVGLFKVMCHLA